MISVIMPAYNAEQFVGEAIQSILDQTYQDFELIIVDDGSTDRTVEIIQSYCAKDPRITLIQNAHGGACKARNDAIRAARYEWIASMDADDVAMPNRLQRQLEMALADPEVVVWGSYLYQINMQGKVLGVIQTKPTTKEAFHQINRTTHPLMVVNPTALFRRDAALKAGLYNEKLSAAQDIEFWDRMADHGLVLVIPEFLMKYRLHGTSISAKRFHEQRMYHQYVLDRNKAKLKGETLDVEAFVHDYKTRPPLERLARYIHNSGRSYYRNTGVLLSDKRYLRAAISLMTAFILSPRFAFSRTRGRFARKNMELMP